MIEKKFDVKIDEVFVACEIVSKKCDFSVKKSDKENGEILLSNGGSFLSWGENISIKLNEEDGRTLVSVDSQSKAQLISFGTNDDNEERFMNELNKLLT